MLRRVGIETRDPKPGHQPRRPETDATRRAAHEPRRLQRRASRHRPDVRADEERVRIYRHVQGRRALRQQVPRLCVEQRCSTQPGPITRQHLKLRALNPDRTRTRIPDTAVNSKLEDAILTEDSWEPDEEAGKNEVEALLTRRQTSRRRWSRHCWRRRCSVCRPLSRSWV